MKCFLNKLKFVLKGLAILLLWYASMLVILFLIVPIAFIARSIGVLELNNDIEIKEDFKNIFIAPLYLIIEAFEFEWNCPSENLIEPQDEDDAFSY